jgi:hypothetical protein
MVKAACQCKRRGDATLVVRITCPPRLLPCRPRARRQIAIQSHRGAKLVTRQPQGLKNFPAIENIREPATRRSHFMAAVISMILR